jgi:GNAT superfamily N-acetyltransferase
MSHSVKAITRLTFAPLTSRRWNDFERLFGANGGCWCMLWRLKRSQFERNKGTRNRAAMKRIVDSGEAAGLLAYLGGEPVGWCAVAPRERFVRLETSRVLQRIDNQPVWSITCLFVAKPFRRRGISTALLRATAVHIRNQGGKIVEGYPIEPKKPIVPDVFAWTGLMSAFRGAGFVEAGRHSPTRPIMRYPPARS